MTATLAPRTFPLGLAYSNLSKITAAPSPAEITRWPAISVASYQVIGASYPTGSSTYHPLSRDRIQQDASAGYKSAASGLGSTPPSDIQSVHGGTRPVFTNPTAGLSISSNPFDDTMLVCSGLGQWPEPNSYNYRGLLVKRGIDAARFQFVADRTFSAFPGLERQQEVNLDGLRGSPHNLRAAARAASQRNLNDLGFPADLASLINQDACDMAEALVRLVQTAKSVVVKIESMGSYGVCSLWHTDHYVGRGIVTYNGSGTMFTPADNVDLTQAPQGSTTVTNDHAVLDPSKIQTVGAGDLLLIKGDKFPHPIHGLVHKAPEKSYHSNGQVKERLVLKVDVQEC